MKIKSLIILMLVIVCSLSLFACNKSEDYVKEYNFSINASSLELEVGDTFQLVAVYSTEEIEFSSANEQIVTVSEDGLITAKALGSTRIIVSVVGKDIVKYCTVNVSEYAYTVEFIVENNYAVNVNAEKILKVRALKDGEIYDSEFSWAVDGTGATIITDKNTAVFKATVEGEYKVTATSAKGATATLVITVKNGFGN